jgi:hypothetical protein
MPQYPPHLPLTTALAEKNILYTIPAVFRSLQHHTYDQKFLNPREEQLCLLGLTVIVQLLALPLLISKYFIMVQLNKAAWIREPRGRLIVDEAPYPVPAADEITVKVALSYN